MSYASWLELHLWFASILLCVFTLYWCSYVVLRDSPKPLFMNLETLLCGSSAVAEEIQAGLYDLTRENWSARPRSQRTLISPAQT